MKRIRGRRVVLLIASALPLLAKDDITARPGATVHEQQQHVVVSESSPLATPQHSSSPSPPSKPPSRDEEEDVVKQDDAYETNEEDEEPVCRLSSEHYDAYQQEHMTAGSSLQQNEAETSSLLWGRSCTSDWSCLQEIGGIPFRYPSDDTQRYKKSNRTSRQRPKSGDNSSSSYAQPVEEQSLDDNQQQDSFKESTDEPKDDEKQHSESDANGPDDEIKRDEEEKEVDEKQSTSLPDREKKLTDEDRKVETVKDESTGKRVEVDYASKAAGALILEQSNNFKGASNLLQKDQDRYAIVPCDELVKYVVIGLSEDILVKKVVLANYERYSSHTKDFRIWGRTTTMGEWNDLGTYTAKPLMNKQTFHVHAPAWARYLKIQFLTHYGSEDYCTMSQISVHGSTMLQGFHEQWGEEEKEEGDERNNREEVTDDNDGEDGQHGDKKGAKDSKAKNDSAQNDGSTDHKEGKAGSHSQESNRINKERNESAQNVCKFDMYRHHSGPNTSIQNDACGFSLVGGDKIDICPSDSLMGFEKDMLFSLSKRREQKNINSNAQPSMSIDAQLTDGNTRAEKLANESQGEELVPDLTNKVGGVKENIMAGNQEDKPVVNRIKNLIRTTADAVDEFGNSLRQRGADENVEKSTTLDESAPHVPSEPIDIKSKDPEKLADAKTDTKPVEEAKQPTLVAQEDDPMFETSRRLAFALRRLPSANCLDKLDFPKFKSELLAARKGNPKGGPGPQGSHPPGNAMEPIFKKLTDEIKALQANVAVHDQFTREAVICYQNVMLDLMMEMETARLDHELRLSQLETDVKAGAWIRSFFKNTGLALVETIVVALVKPVLSTAWSSLQAIVTSVTAVVKFILFDRDSLVAASIRFCAAMGLVIFILYKMGLRIVWRPPPQKILESSSYESDPPKKMTVLVPSPVETPPTKQKRKLKNKAKGRTRAKSFDAKESSCADVSESQSLI